MGECCRWGWLVRQGDTRDEARIKTLGFPFAVLIFLFQLFVIFVTLQGTSQIVDVVGLSMTAFAMVLFIGGVTSNAIPAGYLLDAVLVLVTVGICAVDLGNATASYTFRAWAFVVLLLDISLVFNRDHMPHFIIAVVLVYQVALQVESVSRFGLYEAGYWGTEGTEISRCNCASPPCDAKPVNALVNIVAICIVFLGDFYFTSGFASGMNLQLRRVEVSVNV
eukprot:Hpha_TRINITY_DN15670_c3_g3::TRINITY_DN15670_c3_g3_i9::g.100617::m.100617